MKRITITVLLSACYLLLPCLPLRGQEAAVEQEEREPVIALKTNLLYDAVTAINVGAEVPVGNRVSLAASLIFPNWGGNGWPKTNRYCLQGEIASLEARFWLGNRTTTKTGADRQPLTGHFLGVYGQFGDFDLQSFSDHGVLVDKGYAAGLCYGFSHTINKAGTLRLEYCIGLAYAHADYHTYNIEDHWQTVAARPEWYKTKDFVVPTRAEVSLVWMIYNKKKGGSK